MMPCTRCPQKCDFQELPVQELSSARPRIRVLFIAVLYLVTVVLFVGFLLLRRPLWLFHWSDFRTANKIISKVEAFRTQHGNLPESLQQIGMDDPDLSVFYVKISPDEYCVWFVISLDEVRTYDSRTKRWNNNICLV